MFEDLKTWKIWASFLQHWGVSKYVAIILETVGPMNIIGAQVMYVSYPLFKAIIPEVHLMAMTKLLEDQYKRNSFIELLREDTVVEQP